MSVPLSGHERLGAAPEQVVVAQCHPRLRHRAHDRPCRWPAPAATRVHRPLGESLEADPLALGPEAVIDASASANPLSRRTGRRRSRANSRPFELLMRLASVASLALITACAHTPSQKEREQAAAEYRVGLALVHEAQAAAVEGDAAKQDFKYREALDTLLKAEAMDPGNVDIHYLVGLVYFTGFKRHADAERHLKQAIELREAEYPEAENLLGNVLVDGGRPADALAYYGRARANLLYRTPYYAEEGYGWALFKLGRLDEAATHVRTALVAQPDLCGAYLKLSEIEEARGQLDASAKALDDFIDRCDSERLRRSVGDPMLAYAYFRLGMNRLKGGERDRAAEALRVCTSRFAKEPVASECDKSLKLIE